jgi:endonuclease/exonuclease/phosphatase family metal-dependent hydrolase
MVHKVALLVAALAASLVLAVALAAAGFVPAAGPSAKSVASTSATIEEQATTGPSPTPRVQVDRVYVAPPPPRKTITVHKTIKAPAAEAEDGEDGN